MRALLLFLGAHAVGAIRLNSGVRLRVGDCDMNAMCNEYHSTISLGESMCDPSEGCFESTTRINCADNAGGAEFFTRFRCMAPDCIEMKALTRGAGDCNDVFPKIVGTSMEREPSYQTDFQRSAWEMSRRQEAQLSPGVLGWPWPGKKPVAIQKGPGKGPGQEWRANPQEETPSGLKDVPSLPLSRRRLR